MERYGALSIASAICPVSVPCQINRPGMMPLTWAGLIDWQTIMARRPAKLGSRPQLSLTHAIATGPKICWRERPRISLHAGKTPVVAVTAPGNRSNFDGRTTERAALTVNRPIYV